MTRVLRRGVEVRVTRLYQAECGEEGCDFRGIVTGSKAIARQERDKHIAHHLTKQEAPEEEKDQEE